MKDNACVFCRVIRGELSAARVHEDDLVLAILDLRQANPGHVLVIPKQHVGMIYDLPLDVGAEIMACVVKVSKAVREAFDAEGLSVWQSNGECAGQEVPHVHFHVHPRKPDDGLLHVYPTSPVDQDQATLQQYAERIKQSIS